MKPGIVQMGDGLAHGEGGILLPLRGLGPVRTMVRRPALATVATMSVTVLLDRDGYEDGGDGFVSVLDAVYYASVEWSIRKAAALPKTPRCRRTCRRAVIETRDLRVLPADRAA